MKKKFKLIALIIGAVLMLTACGTTENNDSNENATSNNNKIVIGATSVPHAEILKEAVEKMKEEGIELEIKEFSEWKLLNPALNDKQLDANFFQHKPYLDEYMANSKQNLVSVGPIHSEPMGIYSEKIKFLDELKDGDIIIVPNDTTNEARALLLLEKNGIITLKENAGLTATPKDIVENPKNIKFNELQAAQLPRTISEGTISVINTNYAFEGGLDPINDALAMEDEEAYMQFANIIAVRAGDENNESIKKLYEVLTSAEMKDFINEKYKGAIIPVF